jgi:hypothetical protein
MWTLEIGARLEAAIVAGLVVYVIVQWWAFRGGRFR